MSPLAYTQTISKSLKYRHDKLTLSGCYDSVELVYTYYYAT